MIFGSIGINYFACTTLITQYTSSTELIFITDLTNNNGPYWNRDYFRHRYPLGTGILWHRYPPSIGVLQTLVSVFSAPLPRHNYLSTLLESTSTHLEYPVIFGNIQ